MELKKKIDEMASDAESLLKKGEIDKAAAIYRQIVVLAKDEKENIVILSLLRLGEIAVATGEIDRAIECYKDVEARSLKDGFSAGIVDAIQRRATLLMAAGRWEEARDTAFSGKERATAFDDISFQIIFRQSLSI